MNGDGAESGLGLDQIATASFRTTASADAISQTVKDKLGFGAFNVPARLAIARSLSVELVPTISKGDAGRAIRGDTLFGTGPELAAWVSLLIEHAATPPKDLREFQGWVAAHWERGLGLLNGVLQEVSGDEGEFWRVIAESALPDGPPLPPERARKATLELVAKRIEVPIGEVSEEVDSGDKIVWPMNAPGNSPHSALMGGVGTGKTRSAIAILRSIRELTPVPLIAFDFKGDMTDERNSLDKVFGAREIAPPSEPVPLDVLALSDRSRSGIAMAAQRFRDTIATLKSSGIGAAQRGLLADAAEAALSRKTPCALSDVRDALAQAYSNINRKEDGATATLADLCRFELFRPDMPPETFFKKSWIIKLTADLPDLVKVSVVTLITDALDRYLNSLSDAPTDEAGNRALRILCVVDEAHRILGTRLPGLAGLVRVSRSKGGAVMLISQSPDDFTGEQDDFLSEMGLVAALRTNAQTRNVQRILGQKINLANLETGQALVKIGADPKVRRIYTWRSTSP